MAITLTLEFKNMAEVLDFMQTQLSPAKPTTKPAPAKAAKAQPSKPAAVAATTVAPPVRESAAVAGPDVTDKGFKDWIDRIASPDTIPTLQALLQAAGAQKGSDLTAEQRVQFITDFNAASAA